MTPFSRNGTGNLNAESDPIPEPPDLDLDLDQPIPFRLTLHGVVEPSRADLDDGLDWARGCGNVVAVWICLAALAALVLWGREIVDFAWRMLP